MKPFHTHFPLALSFVLLASCMTDADPPGESAQQLETAAPAGTVTAADRDRAQRSTEIVLASVQALDYVSCSDQTSAPCTIATLNLEAARTLDSTTVAIKLRGGPNGDGTHERWAETPVPRTGEHVVVFLQPGDGVYEGYFTIVDGVDGYLPELEDGVRHTGVTASAYYRALQEELAP